MRKGHRIFCTTPSRRKGSSFFSASSTVSTPSIHVIWWPGTKHWRRSLTVDWRIIEHKIKTDLGAMYKLAKDDGSDKLPGPAAKLARRIRSRGGRVSVYGEGNNLTVTVNSYKP